MICPCHIEQNILSYHNHTTIIHITIIRCTVTEIRKETDRLFVILGLFLPFYHPPPPNDPENQHFEGQKNEKNAWRYNPFIYTCVPEMKII